MADKTGFFKLPHKIWDESLFDKKERFCDRSAWIWLISHMYYAPKDITVRSYIIHVSGGQLYTSKSYLAEIFNWDIHTVGRFLDRAKRLRLIDYKTSPYGLLITFLQYSDSNDSSGWNFEKCTTDAQTDAQKVAQKPTQSDTQLIRYDKINYQKKEKEKKDTRSRAGDDFGFSSSSAWVPPRGGKQVIE